MEWVKKGLIFRPKFQFNWIHSHSWVPTVDRLNDNNIRVYFSSRNTNNFSQTGYFEMDLSNSYKVSNLTAEPVLSLGSLGSFDDSLVVGCSIVTYNDIKYLYYVGWMQGKRVRYYPSIGLALSKNNGKTFKKYSQAPIIERSDVEPFGMASPFIKIVNGSWMMWYASYRKWEIRKEQAWPTYEIRLAESKDGINWLIHNHSCIPATDNEEAVARPYVILENNIFKMWYSYRPIKKDYRIGYAESKNGITWIRKDESVGITVSNNGWDSKMISYPCVFQHQGKKYMLYNGNNFGVDGIGLAQMKV